ncbi:hypothetical protein PGT21_018693 [Puccinia graminis f. sp. tritici]|uniref:Uncharacterized protein n=1 Tax=Puccinia graminis f. sp. tritici TaxID=56615 RepID=A0A5B0NQS2_PUCGR|nr:hypothetical protein PGT21_018693 [Puccinia graminis f. sp. tritici]KAA1125520.1 hypothetical protein PGTUg99_012906 [Puccinia graminis f. sp. tritici]
MLALGLYNSLIILLIGTFKLAGCAPDYYSLKPIFDCRKVGPVTREKCCFHGQYTLAGKYGQSATIPAPAIRIII